ncbi:hypothetical protein PMM1255 [Prochlorococcus marinus subsp. pastoris str. CCMP1986]|uniref:Glycosyltransferase RgtA/B/C/D-like domain-containing protein n=1 Tax=Prochlorococcus marinus subsp. pastoris (strain CCMP1986 / NIES-2087 / MED4) TaxID=59919 RepID=Q7V0K1_PROMP|nr:hypothetical protein [Prochlorococcus marinus]KGF87183.1 hypothetical protein PROCH_0769 [Prochlorococcus marinus str. EQPAC1]CAE19714.1 hypothetical protein PMM1255 [Prochlorococcus marinus subsp. pastoris str. CCMP1986]
MSIKLTSRKAKIIEFIFLIFLIVTIFISFFKPIQAGNGEIGIKAVPLEIGDRGFYILDSDPFAVDTDFTFSGYEPFKGGPLYPNILKGISFISIKLFKQSSTSMLWNLITISISSILTFLTIRFTYASGRLLFDERTGIISMIFFTFSPYSYFYALSGGITIYIMFGTSICTYLILKIFNCKSENYLNNNKTLEKIFLFLVLIYMSLLRPSSIIFCIIVSLIMACLEILNILKYKKDKKLSSFFIFIFIISLVVSFNQLWETRNYSIAALNAFSIEKGTFMGFDRELMRNKIQILLQSSEILKNLEGFLYQVLWKMNDFLTGIIDIRDTHNSETTPLLSFLMRVSVGTTLLAPITYISILGIFIFRRKIINTGLWICLLASIISISPSLIGVAMSRYYYMFITPYILISSMTISKILNTKMIEDFYYNEK